MATTTLHGLELSDDSTCGRVVCVEPVVSAACSKLYLAPVSVLLRVVVPVGVMILGYTHLCVLCLAESVHLHLFFVCTWDFGACPFLSVQTDARIDIWPCFASH